MEINYSTSFFPFSSSKELTSSSSSMSAAGMFNFHDLGDTFQGDDANGMLGFLSDQMDHQVPSGGDNPNNTSHPQEKSFVHEGKGSKGGKKVRKARFAFETRSQVDILDDGYRWRKYGQKAVKNNKFPRSYYRCTHKGCNVKKQVQRLTKDEGVVVTTYEGVHSHQIQNSTDNFEHILSQMQIYTSF